MRSDVLAQINTDDLLHNYHALRDRCGPGVRLCAPLKANAYGHGARVVAPVLHRAGAECAAVATLPEAVELREIGWNRPILVLGNVLAIGDEAERRERLSVAARHRLSLTLTDETALEALGRLDVSTPIDVHVKVDSGMGRMGATPAETIDLLERIGKTRQVRPVGIYSHFATADFEKLELAQRQLSTFREVLRAAAPRLPGGVLRHLANSAATIVMPEAHFDMVRPGLALYGYAPSRHLLDKIELRPILRLVSHVSLVKTLPAGHCVGYGMTFTTQRTTRLGIVPAGYADGFVRSLSNASVVGTRLGDAPVIGRVSMDQFAIDLTELREIAPGDEVTLIDNRVDRPNSVQAIANRLGTIPYEVTCLLGHRIDRIPSGNSCAAAI